MQTVHGTSGLSTVQMIDFSEYRSISQHDPCCLSPERVEFRGMKKTFPLIHPKHQPARQLEAVKGEISKYLKRERKKQVPEGVDFWDFDCQCGAAIDTAEVIHVAELPKRIETLQAAGAEACYIEILAKPGKRNPKSGDVIEADRL